MNDLVSIIVPVYNVEKYLIRCIESILSQTYNFIEIILVDDGSTDTSPQICDDYASRFNNIKVIHQQNSGPSIARNSALDIAEGNFISFVDSDDFVHPKLIEELKRNIDDHKVSISMISFHNFYNDHTISDASNLGTPAIQVINDHQAMDMLLNKQDACAPWGKLYDAKHFKKLRFPPNKVYEDMLTIPYAFKEAQTISLNSMKLYFYNQEGFSITRSIYSKKKILNLMEASRFWKSFANDFYPELANKANLHHLANVLNVCIQLFKQNDQVTEELLGTYKAEIARNFSYLLFSAEFRWQDKVKMTSLRLGLLKIYYA